MLNDHFWITGHWIVHLMMQLTACQHLFWLCLDSLKKIGHLPTQWWPQFPAWASYQIRKITGCTCAGNAGNVLRQQCLERVSRHWLQTELLVRDPGMHHDTCFTYVPWCISGSLTCGDGRNVPGIPGACITRNFVFMVRGPCMCH